MFYFQNTILKICVSGVLKPLIDCQGPRAEIAQLHGPEKSISNERLLYASGGGTP